MCWTSPPVYTIRKTDYGLIIAARRNAGEDTYYWRLTQFLLPSHTMIPYQQGNSIHGHCWVPRDDESCWVWTFTWNPDQPLSEKDWEAISKETFVHAAVDPVTFRPLRNKSNNYLIDRDLQKKSSMTGIHGFAAQDMAIQESMGPLADRTRERLGTSDTAIIAARRLLIRRSARWRQATSHPRRGMAMLYWVRSASMVMNRDVNFADGACELMTASV